MSSTLFNDFSANEPLTRIGEVLVQVGMISLHLQARARLQDQIAGPALAEAASTIARPANETRTNLAAMSRYCLQNLVPRSQALLSQLETVSSMVAALATGTASDLGGGMNSVAAHLERCCKELRGYARSWPRGAGMVRLSEQRLWGALAAALHRVEGTDGPIMRSCSEVERIAFDVGQAIGEFLEQPGDLSLERRCDLSVGLIRAAAMAGAGDALGAERASQLMEEILPGILARLEGLRAERARLSDVSVQLAQALALATQASAQSALAERLRDALCDLERRLAALAAEYRAQARVADRPLDREVILARLNSDAANWHMATTELAKPVELGSEIPDDAGEMTCMARRKAGFAAMIPA